MIVTVRHRPWAQPETRAAQPHPDEQARGVSATDRCFSIDGRAAVPVSGELHYSRLPRERWAERLRQLRAAGITLASTYVFWNHHVAERGRPRFDGALNVGGFIDECRDAGLDVVLRIGPWAHGESRNGGFPDWVQEAAVRHRTDDPGYLELVREWFGQLAAALDGRVRPGGSVIAVQLENELYDQPAHLVTLKRLAREAGIAAPLWTATAWGGAELPDGEVVPLFSGYADGFWADPDADWDPSFRSHFLPSHEWDDPGVGADVRAAQGIAAADPASETTDLHGFAPATCELGSGMATAYHRRPVLDPLDVAALAHNKIGNGSAWQGYFMFVGGRNPAPGLQETIASGYPNDLPAISYDFHAPIGQSGDLEASAPALRRQHAFLAAFGGALAGMTSSLPDEVPADSADGATLRWALRSDGETGFVVVSHHQPYEQVDDVRDVQVRIVTDAGELTLPSRPVDIPAGTLARWPVGITVGETRVRWATASALTLLPGAVPTLVLVADPGIPVELALDDAAPCIVEHGVVGATGADVLILEPEAPVWVQEEADGGRRLLRASSELAFSRGGALAVRGDDAVERYDPGQRAWVPVHRRDVPTLRAEALAPVLLRDAAAVPADYGFGGLRHRAPDGDVFDALAAVHRLELPAWATDAATDAVLEIDWAGDIAELRVDGRTVDDRFWDGTRWTTSLVDAGAGPACVVTLHVLPISSDNGVWLPADARARRDAASPALIALDSVVVRERGAWREVAETSIHH